jgi:peptidyl-prolyl cis-trans isomerase A (cyclophilin A)
MINPLQNSHNQKFLKTISIIGLVMVVLAGCNAPKSDTTKNNPTDDSLSQTAPLPPQENQMKSLADFETIEASSITFQTSKGAITFDLYRDQAPITTANFVQLVKDGFYDGMVFHRVIEDFMAQVGDPLSKDPAKQPLWGTSGPGYTIPDEFDPELKHDAAGVVSMANTGQPNTGGSQIFITHGPTPWLDGKHTIFGQVTEGLDVLEQIEVGDTIVSASYQ